MRELVGDDAVDAVRAAAVLDTLRRQADAENEILAELLALKGHASSSSSASSSAGRGQGARGADGGAVRSAWSRDASTALGRHPVASLGGGGRHTGVGGAGGVRSLMSVPSLRSPSPRRRSPVLAAARTVTAMLPVDGDVVDEATSRSTRHTPLHRWHTPAQR
jgi:hypothetical protein